jgi:hypothetical protein
MRLSRETELAAEHPIHVVANWMGNTPAIAQRHYLVVTDGDFAKAMAADAPGAAESGARAVQNSVQHPVTGNATESRLDGKSPGKTPVLSLCVTVGDESPIMQSGGEGIRTPVTFR